MTYVCEPFGKQIADLEAERAKLQAQFAGAGPEERDEIARRLAEIDHELPGLKQSLADCLSHPRHFEDEAPGNPSGDPRKR